MFDSAWSMSQPAIKDEKRQLLPNNPVKCFFLQD